MAKKEYIFQWSFQSAKEVAGRRAVYTVLLAADGTLSCDCNGWIFPKKTAKKDKAGNKIRSCKHTEHDEVAKNYKDMLKKWKHGEPLPKISDPAGTAPSVTSQTSDANSEIQFGRLVELD